MGTATKTRNSKVVVVASNGHHLTVAERLTVTRALDMAREDVIDNIGPAERVFIQTGNHRTFVRSDGGLHVVGAP